MIKSMSIPFTADDSAIGTPAKSKNNPVRGTYSALRFTINTDPPHRSDDLNITVRPVNFHSITTDVLRHKNLKEHM
ncbi:hypothetical protein, partial [Escherichia coli]|uniref:hypothetical protein n=1 Tax=Escherichia coli TaxID=562 RepID=UPI0035A89FAF